MTHSAAVAELGYESFETINPVRSAPELAAEATRYLREKRLSQQPFYLEVGFFEPHRPFDWGGAVPDHSLGINIPGYLPNSPEARSEFAALQGAIRQMDQAVGTILNTLEQEGLKEDTWVIFTADHGLAMPRAKCTLYDPGIETALIMRWPAAGVAGGQRVSRLTSHVDLVPTILDALRISPPQPLHGRSYWPMLQGEPYIPNDAIYAEKTFHTAYEPTRAIRTERYKLIVNMEVNTRVAIPDDVRQGLIYPKLAAKLTGQPPLVELYDLALDSGEAMNLCDQEQYADTKQSLLAKLMQWMQKTGDPLLDGPIASPYYAAAMEALGLHQQTRTRQ